MKKTEKLQLKLNYDTSVAVLPAAVVGFVDKAKKFDLKVLLLVASHESYREKSFANKIAAELDCEVSDVENSISFWNGTGIISVEAEGTKKANKKEEKAEKTPIPARAKVTELPQYTSQELNALLESHKNVVALIDECQNIIGKIFTAADIKVIMGLVDYLGLDNDYILVLMHHCARKEIKSIRYIEKMAVSCLDEGFTEAAVLQEALYAREERNELEGKIKSVFGIGTRKFTTKEKKQVDAWISNFKYDIQIIERAYDITVGATSKPSIHYANAILEKWYADGARTLEDVDALLAKREEEKEGNGSSFDVDDFFDAALKRSYADKQ